MPTLLHLDRSKFFKRIVHDIVTKKDFEYVSESSLSAAMVLLDQKEVDIIITSKELDKSSGEDFIKELQKSSHKDIPVIVITSDESCATQERFFSMGIMNYLLKSEVSLDRLSRYLDQFIKEDPMVEQLKGVSYAILDDDKISIKALMIILSERGITNVDIYTDPRELLQQEKSYDIYFIDVILPYVNGDEVVRELRGKCPNSVIIAISAIDNHKTMANLLCSGADDYLIKPFDAELAMARLKTNFRTLKALQELEKKSKALNELAIKDGLTNIFNRRYIMEKLDEEIYKARRYKRPLSILLIDIDNFKNINDTWGHLAGDDVIIEFTKIIKDQIRDVDTLGRYGGEEFLIIMAETDLPSGKAVAERIRINIENYSFPKIPIPVTTSGGINQFKDETSVELINKADIGLYKAKKAGKNKIIDQSGEA